jgi:hypothetical protein
MKTFHLIELFVIEHTDSDCDSLREFSIEGNYLKILYEDHTKECIIQEWLLLDYVTWLYNKSIIASL